MGTTLKVFTLNGGTFTFNNVTEFVLRDGVYYIVSDGESIRIHKELVTEFYTA